MNILVVDDQEVIVKGIKFNLENDGFAVTPAYDGEEAVELARSGNFALIVMDLMMPKLDGLAACREIRSFSNVPIIMLTAKSEDADKLIGFESGADDYLTKPFNILELKARVKVLLKRSVAAAEEEAKQAPSAVLTLGGITLDFDLHSASKGGAEVELAAKEFELLTMLMKNPGKAFSRDDLLQMVWNNPGGVDIRTVDVHIRRLREKLENDPAMPEHIMTRWKVGYYFKG
ncbi:MAG: response regulator transcription factor [Oscillospiraceae bacterium]|jgi:DNA-binding response OmpR family regulator|nr:response regulator transcription factor [Oscillospiraceae bacterium]